MTLTVRSLRDARDRYTVSVWPANPRFVIGRLLRGPGGALYRIESISR